MGGEGERYMLLKIELCELLLDRAERQQKISAIRRKMRAIMNREKRDARENREVETASEVA